MKMSFFSYMILCLHLARHINDDRVGEFKECYIKSIFKIVSHQIIVCVQANSRERRREKESKRDVIVWSGNSKPKKTVVKR